jgi:hypothetical protein
VSTNDVYPGTCFYEKCIEINETRVSETAFYVTNDHRFESNLLLRLLEDVVNFCGANVVYYDGEKASVAYSGLCYANGVNGHKGVVLVAECTSGYINILER